MKKDRKKREGVVYSTNPDFKYIVENNIIETIDPNKQLLEICIDKHRAGKTAIIIKNFIGKDRDKKNLNKLLKVKCGVGGSVKDGDIIIQGNVRDKIIDILNKEGYNYKIVGG
tara:strand:+ start:20738 stop:21076 length:339 start_codon:yes stop_codon:yes gene_type:complete